MPEIWEALLRFEIPSQAGLERQAMERVADAVKDYLSPKALERMKTAVAEGALNAIEHGNKFQEEVPVEVDVLVSARAVTVRITDMGGNQEIPENTVPDLEAKLAGLEPTRGWGLFLIRNMVDEVQTITDGQRHTLVLILNRENAL